MDKDKKPATVERRASDHRGAAWLRIGMLTIGMLESGCGGGGGGGAEATMNSIRGSGLRTLTAILVISAMLAYLSLQMPEPPGRVPGPEGQSPDSETSDFIASGGLVPDSAPPVAAEDGESNPTAVTAPASDDATT